jgi:hypothetical protein
MCALDLAMGVVRHVQSISYMCPHTTIYASSHHFMCHPDLNGGLETDSRYGSMCRMLNGRLIMTS